MARSHCTAHHCTRGELQPHCEPAHSMCLDKPAGTTGFLIAQQVTVNQGTTPALVIGAGSSIGTVKVKLLHPQSVTICDLSIGSVSRLRCTFRRGDRVLRAVLSSPGTEEEAKVVRPSSLKGCVHIQLVKPDGTPGIEYHTKTYRLRIAPLTALLQSTLMRLTALLQSTLMRLTALSLAPATAWSTGVTGGVPDSLLDPGCLRTPQGFLNLFNALCAASVADRQSALQSLLRRIHPSVVHGLVINDEAFTSHALHGPFITAVGAAARTSSGQDDKVVDIVFHGTQATNVQSIFRESLRTSPRRGDNWWFARKTSTTRNFGPVPIVFFVLHRKDQLPEPIITTQNKAHQIPIGHLVK